MPDGGRKFFPLMCQMDDKFELVEAEFGLEGFAVIIKLFQKIYGGEGGYFCEWSDEVELLFTRKQCGLLPKNHIVNAVVRAALERGIFYKPLFEKYGILTSHGIQQRYMKMSVRQKKVEMIRQYLLLEVTQIPSNVDIIDLNADIVPQNAHTLKQIKRNKIKRNEIKEKEKEKNPIPKEQNPKELNLKEQNSKEQNLKEQNSKELNLKEQNQKEQNSKDQNLKEQNPKDQNEKEQNQKDQNLESLPPLFLPDSFEMKVSAYLRDKVLEVLPKQTVPKDDKQLQKWAVVIEQMKRLDKMTEEEIKEILEFAVTEDFWRTNIRSTHALRQKRETLTAQLVQKRLMKEKKAQRQAAPIVHKNRFVNYEQRQWDFEAIERMERERIWNMNTEQTEGKNTISPV